MSENQRRVFVLVAALLGGLVMLAALAGLPR